MILTVTLNPAIDKTVKIRRFSPGADHRCKDVFFSAGGKGVNVSRALKNLKVSNLATGFIAGPEGKYIKEELDHEGIRHDFVHISGETRTSLTIIDTQANQITRILEHGPVVQRKDILAFKRKFTTLLKGCRYVVLSGRNIPGNSNRIYSDLICLSRKHHTKAILDTSGEPLVLGLKAKPFLVKPNIKEAEFVLGKRLNTLPKLKMALRHFLGLGIQVAIISLGEKGAVAANTDECWLAQPPRKKTVNTVGCGDALIGGFLCSQLQGNHFQDSVRMAVAVGTANSLNMQPGHFTRTKVAQLAKRVTLKKL